MTGVFEKRIELGDALPLNVLGQNDQNLRKVQDAFDATIAYRNGEVIIKGRKDEVINAHDVLFEMVRMAKEGRAVGLQDVDYATRMIKGNRKEELISFKRGHSFLAALKKPVEPKTVGQKRYLDAIVANDIVVAIGPAGTGKTYLAVAAAVAALRRREVDRILLVRPAVEAGESLGFLPGDYEEKVSPYLRPLYDALREMMDPEQVQRLVEIGTIEVVPLAYMRGRTMNHAFVILDEAQNTTVGQMKMFLTRLGFDSKAVITGDITQIDLMDKQSSGLVEAQDILMGIKGIKFIYLTQDDVVRHHLVREIIKAFDKYAERMKELGKRA
jgi:phosphate starvation-inducible PhoH-like protein